MKEEEKKEIDEVEAIKKKYRKNQYWSKIIFFTIVLSGIAGVLTSIDKIQKFVSDNFFGNADKISLYENEIKNYHRIFTSQKELIQLSDFEELEKSLNEIIANAEDVGNHHNLNNEIKKLKGLMLDYILNSFSTLKREELGKKTKSLKLLKAACNCFKRICLFLNDCSNKELDTLTKTLNRLESNE